MTAGRLFAPPAALAGVIRGAALTAPPPGPYFFPACLQPQLAMVLSGRLRTQGPEGWRDFPRLGLCGGLRRATTAEASPGLRVLVAIPRLGRLSNLLGLATAELQDAVVALVDLVPPAARDLVRRTEEVCEQEPDVATAVAALFDLIAALAARLGRSAPPLRLPSDWLERSPRDLAALHEISPRQFERRFREGFGQSWRSLRRQARCNQLIATLLGGDDPAGWAERAAAAGYADQAHLHRDLVRFTGHRPAALLRGLAGDDPQFWPYRADPRLLARLFGAWGP